MTSLALVALTLATGMLLAAQGPVLARLADHVGGALQAGAVAFAIGFCVLMGLSLVGGGAPSFAAVLRMPPWVWLAGTIGAAVIVVTLYVVPRFGVAPFVAAMICGQLIGALAIDHLGAFGMAARPVGLSDLAGVALLLSGVALVVFDARI